MSRYVFRREDDGKLVRVGFEQMMKQDAAGYITLPDGVQARRCLHLEGHEKPEPGKCETDSTLRPIVSDALGFGEHQLADFEADRQKHGFGGVEFVRDPDVPQFIQVKCQSRREHARYVKHRGMVNRSQHGGGVFLTQDDLDRAKQFVETHHGRGRKTPAAEREAPLCQAT